ncbi:hypothetical protein ADUPG1_014188, partial [Aduncisulcus paluster]
NNGYCDESAGKCVCNDGFEGSICENLDVYPLEKYICVELSKGNSSNVTLEEGTTIDCTDYEIKSSELQYITALNLSSSGITNLDGLRFFTKLTELNVDNLEFSDDAISSYSLSEISNLSELNTFSANNTNIDVSTAISNLPLLSIEVLSLCNVNVLSDTDFSGFASLSELYLSDNLNFSISPSSSLPSTLTALSIDGCSSSSHDLSGLPTSLIYLSANDCGLLDSDLFDICSLPNLTTLSLTDNELTDISLLFRLPALVSLDLLGNKLCSVNDTLFESSFELSGDITINVGNNTTDLDDQDESFCANCDSLSDYSSNFVCKELWDGEFSIDCALNSFRDLNYDSLVCSLIVNASWPECLTDISSNHNVQCILESDQSDLSTNCVSGWYGEDCDIECPLYNGEICNDSSKNDLCNISTHECECDGTEFYGNACQYVSIPDSSLLESLCSLVDENNSADCDLTVDNLYSLSSGSEDCLNLSGQGISDLSGIELIGDITCIDLSDNPLLSDISQLNYLSQNLCDLNISGTNVSSLDQISNVTVSLTSIDISNTNIDISNDIELFGEDLTEIVASGLDLTDLLWVSELDSLQYLDVSDNLISDPTPLFSLEDTLVYVDLSGNSIIGLEKDSSILDFAEVFANLDPNDIDSSDNPSEPECDSMNVDVSKGILCTKDGSGNWILECSSTSYRDVSVTFAEYMSDSTLSPCILIDNAVDPVLYSQCSSLYPDDDHKACIGIGTEYSVDVISIECSEGWYGTDCDSECPVDEYGTVCGKNGTCDKEIHLCSCSSEFSGDVCQNESGKLLCSLDMDPNLLVVICEVIQNETESAESSCSDESVLSSLTVDDLSTITSLTIPTTVSSLSGLEYAEHLEILSFDPGNALISDLSPIASLSSLYVLELDSLENMDVSLLSTLTDAVGVLKMDLESDTSRWNGTSESYCVGLCSLRSLEISGNDDSIGSDLSSFTSLLNNIAMCSGQCVSSYDDGTKVYPLSSTLTHLDLSSNAISDPSIVSLQAGLSGVTHLTLSDNSISDLALLQQAIDGLENVAYVDVSDNRLDCGSTVSVCLNVLADICERDLLGNNVEVMFGDVVDPTDTVSQDTTSACGSDSSSSSSSSCSYLEDHRVCGVDYSVDDVDDTELACICGSGYYEDISSGECVLASSSSSECSNCGGERGTCVYSSDSDTSDESSPLFCECSDGWYGTDCSSLCPVSDDLGLCSGSSRGTYISSGECVLASSSSSSECSNCGGERGTCVYSSDSDTSDESSPLFCECSDGWYGTDCSSLCPVSDDLGLCSGSSRGTCDAATHTCVCESGYYGSSCNLYCDSLSRCGLHGRCAVDDLSSETVYCKCDAGWYGSTCFTQYPVETVEYVNDDDETNPTIVDYVCGVNYSTDPSSSYSDYGIYSSDTDAYSCDCSSYGLITDTSTSTCIDPATHPEYKYIAGNDTACLTCGTTTDSHGTCVLGEGEDSFTAMCQCEYGWSNSLSSESISCSIDVCGVFDNSDLLLICSGNGSCYFDPQTNDYACNCSDGWNGTTCDEEIKDYAVLVIIICSILSVCALSLGVPLFVYSCKRLRARKLEEKSNIELVTSTLGPSSLTPDTAFELLPTSDEVQKSEGIRESASLDGGPSQSDKLPIMRKKRIIPPPSLPTFPSPLHMEFHPEFDSENSIDSSAMSTPNESSGGPSVDVSISNEGSTVAIVSTIPPEDSKSASIVRHKRKKKKDHDKELHSKPTKTSTPTRSTSVKKMKKTKKKKSSLSPKEEVSGTMANSDVTCTLAPLKVSQTHQKTHKRRKKKKK